MNPTATFFFGFLTGAAAMLVVTQWILGSIKREARSIAKEVEQALDDWIVTYAADHCEPEQVKAAWNRIAANGGTLNYVTVLRERVARVGVGD